MTPGSRARRVAIRAAGGTVAALALAMLGGCHTVPIARVAPTPNRPQTTLGSVGRAALLPATVALDEPSELASIDPSNSASGTLTPASAIGTGPRADLISTEIRPTGDPAAPTPLLDAALARAVSQGKLPEATDVVLAAHLPQPAAAQPTEAIAPAPAIVAAPAPLLTSVPVAAAPEPKPAEAVAPSPQLTPEEAWREGVRKLVGLARSKQEQGANPAEPWGLRARVLAWLAEPDIDPDLGQHDADAVRAVLRALQASATTDPRADAHNRGDDVRVAVQTLESRAPLELVDLQLCAKVERFGDYVAFDPPARPAGKDVVIYCEVDGLHHELTPDGYQTRLAGRLEIVPAAGGPATILPLESAKETFPRRRRDYYIAYRKELPRTLAPGQYTLRVTLKDVFTDRSASRATALTIVRDDKDPAPAPTP